MLYWYAAAPGTVQFLASAQGAGSCGAVQRASPAVEATPALAPLIDPNLQNSLNFIEAHLAQHTWFAGNNISMADFQMSFGIEALLARSGAGGKYLQIDAYHRRMRARPAYQRAESKGGPTLMTD